MAMMLANAFRVAFVRNQYRVIDAVGEEVGAYPTEDAAKQGLERCEKDAAMLYIAARAASAGTKIRMVSLAVR
jgi:hypothetical protein